MMKPRQILVATDFGAAAGTALEYGREFARTFGATIHLLHVVEDVITATSANDAYIGDFAGLQRDVEEMARHRLDALVTNDDRHTLDVRPVLRTSNLTAQAIVTFARQQNVDLIVIGTHGRGPMGRLFMGSVAERVVRTAPCPVLTVRTPEHDFLMPDALEARAHA